MPLPVVWPVSWDVFAAYICVMAKLCVCVSVGAALTRSPKNTSLPVKGVRSHRVFPLIHTGLASTVPVVKSTWLGYTKLRHQLPGSHSDRSRENTAKLNNTSPHCMLPYARSHACEHLQTYTLTLTENNQRSIPQWHVSR